MEGISLLALNFNIKAAGDAVLLGMPKTKSTE
jgi:hypothetical protein